MVPVHSSDPTVLFSVRVCENPIIICHLGVFFPHCKQPTQSRRVLKKKTRTVNVRQFKIDFYTLKTSGVQYIMFQL